MVRRAVFQNGWDSSPKRTAREKGQRNWVARGTGVLESLGQPSYWNIAQTISLPCDLAIKSTSVTSGKMGSLERWSGAEGN